MQGASPLESPGLNPGGAGAGGAILHRVGGLPRRCRITLPSLSPMGGGHGGFGRRLNLPHHRFFVPIPPTRARRALFPHGEGGDFGFISPGATAPGTPAPEPERRGGRGAILHQAGGLHRRCRITLPSLSPMGGAGGFGHRIYQLYQKVLFPIPPTPFPSGEGGAQGYFVQGASPLASPGLNPGGTGAGAQSCTKRGRGRNGDGLSRGGARTPDCTSNSFGKSSWGFGGFFQEAPNVSSFLRIFVSSL